MKTLNLLLLSAVLATSAHALDKTAVKATANTWESKEAGGWADCPPELAVDGEVSGKSSWRGEKHEGVPPHIDFEFPEKVTLDGVNIIFLNHFKRTYTIDILGSDGGEWQMLAEKVKNPGEGEKETTFMFEPTELKKLRIVGHGNTNEKFADWTNIIEIYFLEPQK